MKLNVHHTLLYSQPLIKFQHRRSYAKIATGNFQKRNFKQFITKLISCSKIRNFKLKIGRVHFKYKEIIMLSKRKHSIYIRSILDV